MLDKKYLNDLIENCNKLREKYVFFNLENSECIVSYMPTKKRSFVGYKHGDYEVIMQQKYKMKENSMIRANCKNYIKLFRDTTGELLQIQRISNGRIDVVHQAHRIKNTMYLFPFSPDGGFYPTYTYVTKYGHNCVVEEYMVSGNQIIYEKYDKKDEVEEYLFTNYVRDGTYPILEERKGIFTFEPLEYKEIENSNWTENRK